MDISTARRFFLWCAVLNYGILLVWFIVFEFAHEWMRGVHTRWFTLSVEQFDGIHYATMAVYKVLILLFCLVPYFALTLSGRRSRGEHQ